MQVRSKPYLFQIITARLIMTVTSMVRPVTGGPGAPVPVGMVFVYVRYPLYYNIESDLYI